MKNGKSLFISLIFCFFAACNGGGGDSAGGPGTGGTPGGGDPGNGNPTSAPSALSYANFASQFVAGIPLEQIYSPTVSGNPTTYSVSPSFPAGILLNTTNGNISGMATAPATRSTYVVTASNSAGNTSVNLAFSVRKAFPVAYGSVNALHLNGNQLFVGGAFSFLGEYTGSAVIVDGTNGNAGANYISTIFNGPVYAAIGDPSNPGWFYVAGGFTQVGSVNQKYLARVQSDGTLDTGFAPNINGEIYALAADSSAVYAGGSFTMAGASTRDRLVAVNKNSGALLSWSPSANSPVYALFLDGTALYVGGTFGTLAGSSRNGVGSVSTVDGSLQSWDPALTVGVTEVYAITKFKNQFYLGGRLSKGAISNLAVFNSDGTHDTGFGPNPDAPVYAFAVHFVDSLLYVGGEFANIGGSARKGIALFDGAGATPTLVSGFDPALAAASGSPAIYAMSLVGSSIHVGGKFASIGGTIRANVAQLNGSGGTLGGSFDPKTSSPVKAFAYSNATFLIGGDFTSLNGTARNSLASFDVTTGVISTYNPNVTGTVNAISSDSTKVYFGGDFSNVGGSARADLAASLLSNGSLDSAFQPATNSGAQIYAVQTCGGDVYVGGSFTDLTDSATVTVVRLAKVSPSGTIATTWGGTGASAAVRSFLCDGNNIYVGGDFTTLNGNARTRVAHLALSNSADSGFSPVINNGGVNTMVMNGTNLILGGSFTSVETVPVARSYLATYSTAGVLQAFAPSGGVTTTALAADNTYLYLAAGAYFRRFRLSDGVSDGVWANGFGAGYPGAVAKALALATSHAFIGGDFSGKNGQVAKFVRDNLAGAEKSTSLPQ